MVVLGGHEQEHIDPMLGLFYVDLKLPAGFSDHLSMAKKMMDPMYQDCKSDQIQEYNEADGSQKVRVIAGETHGVKGSVIPNSESLFYDVHLGPDTEFRTDIPVGFEGMIFVYQGKNLSLGENGQTTLGFEQTTIFEANEGVNKLVIKAKNSGAKSKCLVIAGLTNK